MLNSRLRFLCVLSISFLFHCTPQSQEKPMNTNEVTPPSSQNIDEMNDQEIMQLAKEIARQTIIVDGHVDLPYRMEVAGYMLRKSVEDVSVETQGNFDYPKAKRGGLDAPFMSIYIPSRYQNAGDPKAFADSLIEMTMSLPERYPKLFAPAGSPEEVRQNFEKGVISLPMGMENGAPLGKSIENVKYFFDRGIRYITLTHSKDNQICDSSYDNKQTWKGLSPFGKEVVEEMNRVGIMVDISHVSDEAFDQVLTITKAPIIASHSSCRHFTPGFERNMSDDMIRRLGQNRGVIHINFGSNFLSPTSRSRFNKMQEHLVNYRAKTGRSSKDSTYQAYAKAYALENDVFGDVALVADHIDRVVNLAGIDHVAFGSDFDGVSDKLPEGLKDVSMYPNIIYELLKRGYKPEDIEKICYENSFRVWNEVIEVAKGAYQP